MVEQLEAEANVVGKGPLAAADDDGREEQVQLVDQAGPDGLRGESGATDGMSLRASALIRRTASGSKSRSIRVRAVDGDSRVRE
ncbi:MAG: hypothetical protein WD810_05140 [Solirubrobacterales bacterium]